jgi:hypothetical protein
MKAYWPNSHPLTMCRFKILDQTNSVIGEYGWELGVRHFIMYRFALQNVMLIGQGSRYREKRKSSMSNPFRYKLRICLDLECKFVKFDLAIHLI